MTYYYHVYVTWFKNKDKTQVLRTNSQTGHDIINVTLQAKTGVKHKDLRAWFKKNYYRCTWVRYISSFRMKTGHSEQARNSITIKFN